MLVVDPAGGPLVDGRVGELARLLGPGDLLVVNDAATLPASLPGHAGAAPIELRLAGERPDGLWSAVLFGAGDWRTPTERRPAPPEVAPLSRLVFEGGLEATVLARDSAAPRLLTVGFDRAGAALWAALYRAGRAVQYAHTRAPLALWDVQTAYAARPWAVEAPSAGLPLGVELLSALRRRGVALARVTHAAGLSATGDAALDARLPLPERYHVGADAVLAIREARRRGGRVVAVGTSVVRALEGAAVAGHGALAPGGGVTALRIGPDTPLRVVDGLLSGQHEPGTSHFELASAFAARAALEAAHAHALRAGYRGHEFGDSVLILPRRG
ncbi:MAG: S-adenosylmethionine:tRNA ribosyltransferase-isomerase [Deltaproteobacteria bacterium]|nr:S-adenosylmethionine:tRNA ribosyltransferase-isomerase [Deltaproteobacteria bacterium]